MYQFSRTLKRKSKANPIMEGGKLGTDNGFAQNFALQQVMKRTRYRLGSGKTMNTPMQKKSEKPGVTHIKDPEFVKNPR